MYNLKETVISHPHVSVESQYIIVSLEEWACLLEDSGIVTWKSEKSYSFFFAA